MNRHSVQSFLTGQQASQLANQAVADQVEDSRTDETHPISAENDPQHDQNFLLIIAYQVCFRIGWIFKTETIIMPAVLDAIGGSGWLRGCLPMLNRLGQSLPALLASDRIRGTSLKKQVLFSTTLIMGLCFLALSLVWMVTGGQPGWSLQLTFLVIYGVFFASTGINMLVLNTLVGKLVKTRKRGRLSLIATLLGSGLAVTFAWWLLGLWLEGEPGQGSRSRFELIFAFTGACFVGSALISLQFRERSDASTARRRNGWQLLAASVSILKRDRNFLLLATIASMFGLGLTLGPHYQRLASDRLDLTLTALIPWVIAQNIGAGLFSIPAGWMADRFGTRHVLQYLLLAICATPMLALVLVRMDHVGTGWFSIVFGLLGLTPVTMRMFNYYTLEASQRTEHPAYLSTMSIAMSVPPILLGSLTGALVDWVSFEFVFIVVTAFMLFGWVLTFFLIEPRHES